MDKFQGNVGDDHFSRPTNIGNLCMIDGVAEQRADMQGQQFIRVIESFCKERKWLSDTFPDETANAVKVHKLRNQPPTRVIVSDSHLPG